MKKNLITITRKLIHIINKLDCITKVSVFNPVDFLRF